LALFAHREEEERVVFNLVAGGKDRLLVSGQTQDAIDRLSEAFLLLYKEKLEVYDALVELEADRVSVLLAYYLS